MTHTYKVGDKGKTACTVMELYYEITASDGDFVIAKITGPGGNNVSTLLFTATGKTTCGDSGYDLIPPKRRIQGWVNVYPSLVRDSNGWCGEVYATRESANETRMRDRLACIYIDIEEGEGL